MSSTPMSTDAARRAPGVPAVPMRYEVTVLPVADVDRAKAFYEGLGWRLDADFPIDEHYRVVQFTPPGSPASIQFGTGLTTMTPGSMEDLYLIVDDVEAARDDLIGHGADVSEVWHGRGAGHRGARARPRPGATVVPQLRLVRRSGRQPLAAAGDHASGSRAGWDRWTSRPSPSCCTRPPSVTAPSRRPPRRTTGGTGTRPTWTPASAGAAPDEASAAAGRYMAEVKHVVA